MYDPLTNTLAPLFNPRQHQWQQHFQLREGMQIEPLTPEGRVTVLVLGLNIDWRVRLRQQFALVGEYPCA